MKPMALLPLLLLALNLAFAAEPRLGTNQIPADWRAEKRLIDLHLHINHTPDHLSRAITIMDSVGIGVGVNLSGGTVTKKDSSPSDFERNKNLADRLFPGRFLHYMNLDYSGWDEPDFALLEPSRIGIVAVRTADYIGLGHSMAVFIERYM